jgi:osmotically-inducible protein OsmY
VDNGRVTLKGVVSSKVDQAAALARANAVSGIFDVKNELVIEEGTS